MANICTGTFYSYQSVTTCGTVHSLVCTTSLLVVRVVTVLSELALTSEKRTSAPPHSGRGRCQTMATTAADASVATDISVFQGRPATIHRVRKNMLGCYDRPDENCAVSACSCRHQVSRGRHASSGHPGRHVPRYDPQTSGGAAEAASTRPGGRGGSAFFVEGAGDVHKEIRRYICTYVTQ